MAGRAMETYSNQDGRDRAFWDYLAFFTPRRVGKLLFGVVVAVLAIEAGIRLWLPQNLVLQRDLVTADEVLGFRMVPNYKGAMLNGIPFTTSSWGLRDREYDSRHPESLRVYVLGDSIVFGLGVALDDAFPRQLEGLLAQRLGRPVEVVNGGIPGYGTLQELAFFEETFERVRPDLVLLGVTIVNDVTDNIKFTTQLIGEKRPPHLLHLGRNWLRAHSQLYLFAMRQKSAISPDKVMAIHAVSPSPSVAHGLRSTEKSLQDFAAAARRRGVGFGMILIPAQIQVSPATWADMVAKTHHPAASFAADQPNASLTAFAKREGIPTLDLLPVLRSMGGDSLYLNEHWLPRGHTIVATKIADFLSESRLIAPQQPGAD